MCFSNKGNRHLPVVDLAGVHSAERNLLQRMADLTRSPVTSASLESEDSFSRLANAAVAAASAAEQTGPSKVPVWTGAVAPAYICPIDLFGQQVGLINPDQMLGCARSRLI